MIRFNKVCLFFMGVFSVSQINAMTFEHVKILWSNINNVAGYHVVLELDDDKYINAVTYYHKKITVTQGLLDFCQSDQEMVLVLGHELGHWAAAYDKKAKCYGELCADVLGDRYCRKLGYTNCLAFMYHIRKAKGEMGGDGIHPTWTHRINNVIKNR